jgi:hypothetical protein
LIKSGVRGGEHRSGILELVQGKLIKREVRELRETHTHEPGAQIIDRLFHILAVLGPLRSAHEIIVGSTPYQGAVRRENVAASYVIPATFRNGDARINLDLRQVSGEAQISGFSRFAAGLSGSTRPERVHVYVA